MPSTPGTQKKFCSILGNSEVESNLIRNTQKNTESLTQQHNASNEGELQNNCR